MTRRLYKETAPATVSTLQAGGFSVLTVVAVRLDLHIGVGVRTNTGLPEAVLRAVCSGAWCGQLPGHHRRAFETAKRNRIAPLGPRSVRTSTIYSGDICWRTAFVMSATNASVNRAECGASMWTVTSRREGRGSFCEYSGSVVTLPSGVFNVSASPVPVPRPARTIALRLSRHCCLVIAKTCAASSLERMSVSDCAKAADAMLSMRTSANRLMLHTPRLDAFEPLGTPLCLVPPVAALASRLALLGGRSPHTDALGSVPISYLPTVGLTDSLDTRVDDPAASCAVGRADYFPFAGRVRDVVADLKFHRQDGGRCGFALL
jgi:hypothetical protein